jgi:Phosphate transporter family
VKPAAVIGDARDELTSYLRTKSFSDSTMLALRQYIAEIGNEVRAFHNLRNVPADRMGNLRNEMYVVSESIRLMQKTGTPAFTADEKKILANYRKHVDLATKFIPTCVKIAVAIALGMGTMIGWKRIVVTVGEKIGKTHLSYGQGAAAELTAMGTILAADNLGLPVSTTHVLSSGVAGTGSQPLGPAVGDGAESVARLGSHAAFGDDPSGLPVLGAAKPGGQLTDMESTELDRLRQDYLDAVDEWRAAIRHEEELATPDHTMGEFEAWDRAHLSEKSARERAKRARDGYKDALRRVLYGF